MKKLLVLALSALLVLGLATVSMAAATLSGEIDVKVVGNSTMNASGNLDQTSSDQAFGKMVLNGKLGDDLTGNLTFKADPVNAGGVGPIAVDEASLTFTEDWGTLKTGYFGWNNNVKDILDVFTGDVKSQTVVNPSFMITDNVKFGFAYGFNGSTNPYGVDLGFAADTFGVDALYYNYGQDINAWGINAYIKLGDFKPFLQYRNYTNNGITAVEEYNVSNSIIGFTWTPADQPVYARAEVDLSDTGAILSGVGETTYEKTKYNTVPWGIRFGYNLSDGAAFEAQYKVTGYNDPGEVIGKTTDWSAKIIAKF